MIEPRHTLRSPNTYLWNPEMSDLGINGTTLRLDKISFQYIAAWGSKFVPFGANLIQFGNLKLTPTYVWMKYIASCFLEEDIQYPGNNSAESQNKHTKTPLS